MRGKKTVQFKYSRDEWLCTLTTCPPLARSLSPCREGERRLAQFLSLPPCPSARAHPAVAEFSLVLQLPQAQADPPSLLHTPPSPQPIQHFSSPSVASLLPHTADTGSREQATRGGRMGNCASAIDTLFQRGNRPPPSPAATPGMSASRRTSCSATTGKLSTLSTSTFMPSTVSGVSVDDDEYPEGQILESPDLKIYTFAELKSATKNFRPETVLGEGGFGKVYKGWVDEKTLNPSKSSVGMVVAVKKLNPESVQGMEQWQSEVNFLGRISHPNLVKLLGYCMDDNELLLVYEFMSKGSLENHLFRRGAVHEPLPWTLRLKILIGAARGLAFLHSSERQIIYRDFKASNILLDSHFNAKLSDFGLAKHGPDGGESHVTTRVMGTYGYAAPEYVSTGHLYVKSDVYGFGVVLLEMISGLRALDPSREKEMVNLVNWAKPLLADRRKLSQVMDSGLEGQYNPKGALLACQMTLKCLNGDPKSRPSMKEVVETLEQIESMKSRVKEPRTSPSLSRRGQRHSPRSDSSRKNSRGR